MAKRKTLADVLRKAIRDCGVSANELARRTGLKQPTITVFLNGGDIRLDTAQKLIEYFGLEVDDELVLAIYRSPKSDAELAKLTGLTEIEFRKFVGKRRQISPEAADRLRIALRLEPRIKNL